MEVIFILIALVNLVSCGIDYEVDDALELIKSAGYEGFSYPVVTDDGYILKVHRIKPATGVSTKPPVFLQHGLFATSADFIMTGPNIALAYLLADNGYDVWLSNSRGNKHSENHVTLSNHSKEFWSFSFNELGHYDLPAIIDYVLNVTKAAKLFCVGHSQGTSALITLLSTRPEYNQKVIQAHLLAPSVVMAHIPHPLVSVLANQIRNGFLSDLAYIDVTSYLDFSNDFSTELCTQEHKEILALCTLSVFSFAGSNRRGEEIDTRILKTIVQHISPKISVQQLVHFIQIYSSGKFQKFDYTFKNLDHYNSTTPPLYDLSSVTSPVYIYIATEDLLVSPIDAQRLEKLLPNVRRSRVIRNWNHIDFTYGKNARKVLYESILQDFESFQ